MLQPESSRQTKQRRTGNRDLSSDAAPRSILETERIDLQSVTARTIFLTGRECPLACTMCDLWQHTTTEPTATGSIPAQVSKALSDGLRTDWIKLYNASNFFDPLAVPPSDYAAIAELCNDFERVVVENHPAFNNRYIEQFQSLISGKLEIAIGLESTDDGVLKLLNKQMTAIEAATTIGAWREKGIDVRAFILIKPPSPNTSASWQKSTVQSVVDALAWGVRHVSLIPTRATWGLLLEWTRAGLYTPPTAKDVEDIAERCASLQNDTQSISIDLWDWHALVGHCEQCAESRRLVLQRWNESGQISELSALGKLCSKCL